jgi:adenylate cyclase
MESFSIDKTLEREILLSEKLRAKILAWTFVYAIIALLVLRIFFLDYMLTLVSNISLIYFSQGILALFIIREIVVIKVINNRIAAGKGLNVIFRYITNMIEISYPTIVLVVLGSYLESIVVLFTPIVYFYFFGLILSTLSLEFKISFYAGIMAAVGYITVFLLFGSADNGIIGNNFLGSEILHISKAALLIIGGAVAGLVANQIKKKIININNAQLERHKILNMFGQQVSSSIVDELLNNNNKIESGEKFVCIMFLDIRGFTLFAENKKPEDIIGYQNRVFGFMIDIINKHHGIINQFMGDGFMATFGVPLSNGNDTQNAVNAALEITEVLNEKNVQEEIPATRIGIGLHSGLVVAGNVGTEERKQYSISGNTVITAARLEQLNKEYQSQILISKEVLDNIELTNIEPLLLGNVQLKGQGHPTEIWQLK